MNRRFVPLLEHPVEGFEPGSVSGTALARVVEAHPALSGLLDFQSVDPIEIALDVGMVFPLEEDGVEDLEEIDLGAPEWFEPSAGLAAIQSALGVIKADPAGIAAAIYDPGLRPEEVISDLEALERVLLLAQQQETRFRLAFEGRR